MTVAETKPGGLWELDRCPDRERLHTPCPSGYSQWHAWAARQGRTHAQKRCPTCGLYAIWVPRHPNRRGPTRGDGMSATDRIATLRRFDVTAVDSDALGWLLDVAEAAMKVDECIAYRPEYSVSIEPLVRAAGELHEALHAPVDREP